MKKLLLVFCLIIVLVGIPAFAETKTLNFLEVMTSPERTIVLRNMIADYEASHPGISINLISPPYEQAVQKEIMMINSNQPLDIIEVNDNDLKQFTDNKKLANLTGNFKSWKEAKSLTPLALSLAKTIDNTPYVVPQFIFTKALFVRTDVLKQNGVNTLPKTMDDLLKICIKITNPAKNQYGFAWRGKNKAYKFAEFVPSAYVKDMKNYSDFYSDQKAFFNDPGYIQGMKVFVDLFQKASPPDSINWGFNEQINGFVSGVTPFLLQDPDAIPLIDKVLDPNKYTVIPLPVGPYGFANTDHSFAGLAIPSYSKNQNDAWQFIQWMSSAEKNGYFCERYGALPVHSSTFKKNKYFQSKHYQAYLKEMATPKVYYYKNFPVTSPKWPAWGQIEETDFQAVLLGQAKLETVLNKWQEYWTK